MDRKGYLTLLLQLNKEDNVVLRRAENIRDWYTVILSLVQETRARNMPRTEEFWTRKSTMCKEPPVSCEMAWCRHVSLNSWEESIQRHDNNNAALWLEE